MDNNHSLELEEDEEFSSFLNEDKNNPVDNNQSEDDHMEGLYSPNKLLNELLGDDEKSPQNSPSSQSRNKENIHSSSHVPSRYFNKSIKPPVPMLVKSTGPSSGSRRRTSNQQSQGGKLSNSFVSKRSTQKQQQPPQQQTTLSFRVSNQHASQQQRQSDREQLLQHKQYDKEQPAPNRQQQNNEHVASTSQQKPPVAPKQTKTMVSPSNKEELQSSYSTHNIQDEIRNYLKNDLSSLVAAQMESFKREFVLQQQQLQQQSQDQLQQQKVKEQHILNEQQNHKQILEQQQQQQDEKQKVMHNMESEIKETLEKQFNAQKSQLKIDFDERIKQAEYEHRQSIQSLKNSYELQMNEVQVRADRQISEYKRTIQQQMKDMDSLNDQIDSLEQSNRKQKETIEQQRNQLNNAQSSQSDTVDELQQQLDQLQRENEHLQHQLENGHRDHEQLSAKYKDLDIIRKQELATLQYQISSLEERMRHMISNEKKVQQSQATSFTHHQPEEAPAHVPQDSSPLVKFHNEDADRQHDSMHELNYDNHPINQPQFHSSKESSTSNTGTPLRSTMRSSNHHQQPANKDPVQYHPAGSFHQTSPSSQQTSSHGSKPKSSSSQHRSPKPSPKPSPQASPQKSSPQRSPSNAASSSGLPPAYPGRSMKTMNDLVMAHQFPERQPATTFSDHPGGTPLTTAQYLSKQSKGPSMVIQSPTKPKRKKVHKIRSTKKYEDILRSNSRRRSSRKRKGKTIKVPKKSAETVACESKLDILKQQIQSWEERESNATSQVKRSLSGVYQFLDNEGQHAESRTLVDSIKNQLSTVLTLAEALLLSNIDRLSICKHIIDLVNRDSYSIESCLSDVSRYLGDCIRDFSNQQVQQGSILTTIREHEVCRQKKESKHLKKSASHCLAVLDKAEKKGDAVMYYGIPYRLIIERDALQRELDIRRAQDEQLKSWAARKRL